MQWQEFRTYIRHLPTRDINRLECAFALGKKVHENQKRKSGEPYFTHPVAVAHILADLGADSDTLIAALLHDTVEDTPLTLEEIDKDFGGSVAAIIDGVTKLSAKDVAMSPQLNEQTETLRKIFTLMQQDVRIMVIKLVDRLHNMQTIEFLSPERQKTLAKETLEVFVKIADKLCMQDLRDELEALCLAVLEPSTFRELSELRDRNEERGRELCEVIRRQIRSHDAQLAARVSLHFEFKTWEKLRAQMHAGDAVTTGLSSLTIAFVADDVDSCYRTLGALHQLWQREVLSFQDFINAPQLNGYQGLHTTIIVTGGERVRCKIRTKDMQEYARKGIAIRCFDAQAKGLPEYLPWTQRISPLTTDTEGNSTDFWQNLQSDILGESIVIHGPDDSTAQIPRNATALDGVFYLMKDMALRTVSIRVNGEDCGFGTKLTNAASISVALSEKQTCTLDWLKQVETGLATAMIRSALSKQSESTKLDVGKTLLQEVFTENKRGFIDEFDEQSFKAPLGALGLGSLRETYISIADGRILPEQIFGVLFSRITARARRKTPTAIIHYEADMSSVTSMDRLNLVHRKYGEALSDIRYRRMDDGAAVSLQVRMSPQELTAFQNDLILAGAKNVELVEQSFSNALLIAAIVVLWGLDPLVARLILTGTGIQPGELTLIRFLTFFLASSGTYGLYLLLSPVRAKPISALKPSFLAAAGSLFLTAILSYAALRIIPASQYILIIIAGLVLTTFLNKVIERKLSVRILGAATLLAGCIFGLAIVENVTETLPLLAAVGASLGFAIYTQLSKRYLETDGRIHARYPAFVFWLSVITILLTIPLWMLVGTTPTISTPALVLSALFSLVFTFLPYALFFECMMKTDTEILDRLLPFVCVVTIIGEAAATGSGTGLYFLPAIAVFLWLYKPKNRTA